MPGDVHVERGGRGTQNVVVNGRYFQSAFQQLGHDRCNFRFQQHKIAHHHCLIVNRRERHPSS